MADLMDQQYELVPLDRVEPHPENARQGDTGAIHQSIEHNGFFGAALVQRSTGHILAGSHRWRAAKASGLPTLPVLWVDCDDDRAKRIMLADNRTNDLASYDEGALLELLSGMALTPEGLAGSGFDVEDLDELAHALGPREIQGDPDEVPPKPKTPRTVSGDVWVLGPHRLICGDSTEPTVVDRVMAGNQADCIWTDPPYGVEYVGKTADALTLENDYRNDGMLERLLRGGLSAASSVCRPGAVWFVAAPAGPVTAVFGTVLAELGVWRQTLVWVKDVFVLGHSDFHYRHELVYYGWTPGEHRRPPDRTYDTVLEVDRPKRSKEHPTMKPVQLIDRCLQSSTQAGDVVLDPFGGSGSSLIAAHAAGRKARLVELDPSYCDVICRRYQEATGDKPVAAATNEPHDFTEG